MASKPVPRRRVRVEQEAGPLASLAAIIRDRRLALALTQADLAALAGVGGPAVHKLENGLPTTTRVLLQVLDALGLALAVAPRPELPAAATLPGAGA